MKPAPCHPPILQDLPGHLLERSRVILGADDRDCEAPVNFVVYWMRSAIRCHENPALDVARRIAERRSVPLLVYQGLSEHYQFASDRHHTFILEGARDVQQEFQDQGISYAFHLATPNDRGRHLVTLADEGGIVVTEDMPVDPPRRFLNALVRQTTATLIAVDTACIAPMQRLGKAYTRAFKFRSATKQLYAEKLTASWPETNDNPAGFDLSRLAFEPTDLTSASLVDLVARCEIDHSVGPVRDTPGGCRAGYRRWNRFKATGLRHYAKRRNNALIDGVSRMSAYLHYGMVSPFRIAREAAELDHAGSEKYLDELLIWRELAYHYCFYHPNHDRWETLPVWARETLANGTKDHRHNVYSWEDLTRGKTDSRLWNAAQKSLLMHGELHNNVRMTWGKAILAWTKDPQTALRMVIDLNHRYALDGRDPASYGGILWCFGQFDRPFDTPAPILGTVRPRPIDVHANRLDPAKYMAKVSRVRLSKPPRIAVVGAGLAGLFAARTLVDHGLEVVVFEKSRGPAGRMSTRRADQDLRFDHGAQYFTVRDPRFRRYVRSWQYQGLVARWPDQQLGTDQRIVVLRNGNIESESSSQQRYVGTPTMNTIGKHLAMDLDLRRQTRVSSIVPLENGAQVLDDEQQDLGTYQHVLVTAPAEQSVELLSQFPAIVDQIKSIDMNPCWATMVAVPQPVSDQWCGAFIHDSFLSWVARNSTKPGRGVNETLVLHATSEWTQQHWDRDPQDIGQIMLEEFWRVSGATRQSPYHLAAHRWRYAIATSPSHQQCFHDQENRIVVGGDWACGSRVEGAFLSGMAMAGRVLGALQAPVDNSPGEPTPQQLELFSSE